MAEGFPSLSHTSRAFPLPTVSEDTLHYALHLPPSSGPSADASADTTALATLITTHVTDLLPMPWLWNKDAWELKFTSSQTLGGTMRVGDAVDDEWLVVWLLREVSRRWPDLVISVRDTDGEFLLIEAAHELPPWVAPENADNRLWMYGGHLHLLPLSVTSAASTRPKQIADDDYDDTGRAVDAEAWVNEEDALAAVRTGRYRAPDAMEAAVWARIACYPDTLKTHQHRTKAYLPVPVARALSVDPGLVQRAVEGFYVRDPAQLRAAASMKHFPPSPAVLTSVLMTRAAYAQLNGQVFHPPRVFGPEWHVPEDAGADETRWRDLGVKIATGFEIMYREGGRNRTADEASTDDPEYQRYLADLTSAGFFGGELQGSAEWKVREAKAAKGWIAARSSDTAQGRQSFAYRVDQAVKATESTPAEALEAGPNVPEDSDKWLEVNPDELDAMMMRASGPAVPGAKTELGEEHGKALQDLASKVHEFVGGQGDLDGARFADELSDMDTDSEDETPAPTPAEREERLKNLVPALPAEEWGRKQQPQDDVEMTTANPGKGTVAGTTATDQMLPTKMRPPVFAKQEFDGVVSDSSDDEDDLPPPGTLGRHIAQMKWSDGAPRGEPRAAHIEEVEDDTGDADDKADRARAKGLRFDDDIDEIMRQRVWGGDEPVEEETKEEEQPEGDVDMDDEEEDFLRFSREALGISDDQWENILASRRERGAFVPAAGKKKTTAPAPAPPKPEAPRVPNQALNSFESMMAAMEGELAKSKEPASSGAPKVAFTKPASSKPKFKGKGKPKLTSLASLPTEAELDEMDDDALAAMDAELREALKGHAESDDELVPEARDLSGDAKDEYRMMSNLLESFKSQGGEAGAVGNLFGRLGEGGK